MSYDDPDISPNVRAALRRPANYSSLSPRRQWDIDADLGILDWEPTAVERAQYLRLTQEGRHDRTKPKVKVKS